MACHSRINTCVTVKMSLWILLTRIFSVTVFIFLLLAATFVGGGSSPLWGVPDPVLVYQRPIDAMVDVTNDLGVAVLQVGYLQFIALHIILKPLYLNSFAVDCNLTCTCGRKLQEKCVLVSFLFPLKNSWFEECSLLRYIAVKSVESQRTFRTKLCLLPA
jgi:hypothetical protein